MGEQAAKVAMQMNEKGVVPGPGQQQSGIDPFADYMLDTLQNTILKNAETKSIILAPFNSTKSNLDDIEANYSVPSDIRELIQSKSCIKFHACVREIDKQYEVNNNEDLDNGVYHDFNRDDKDEANKDLNKEDSLEEEFKDGDSQNGRADKGKEL